MIPWRLVDLWPFNLWWVGRLLGRGRHERQRMSWNE